MNLFTRFLAQRSADRPLHELIAHWDQVEALVIAVYKSQQVATADRQAYAELRAWLERHYPAWEARLAPHWQATRVNGELLQADPFRRVWQATTADEFLNDWGALQHLAAAREALNRLLLSAQGAAQ